MPLLWTVGELMEECLSFTIKFTLMFTIQKAKADKAELNSAESKGLPQRSQIGTLFTDEQIQTLLGEVTC